jgi:hypothetical protein
MRDLEEYSPQHKPGGNDFLISFIRTAASGPRI